ncbi:MAG: DUF1257 domain-containing protein [Bacteroidetes bacterium]|nr:DUF1257 domain-containing protein [Bacteroidota bacterium]
MSKFVSIETKLRERLYLKSALEQLNCQMLKTKKIKTLLNRTFDVDLAVKAPFGIVGFRKDKSGEFNLVGDDMILAKNRKFAEQLAQQYAYAKVIAEAKKAGFQLVKEMVEEDKTMRLVLRKW